jgi:hypothetical protein
MEQTINYKKRVRVNITQNSRGVGYEFTMEMTDTDNDMVIREAHDLQDRLKKAFNC